MHKPIAFLLVVGLVVTSTIIAVSPASAIPITYTEQATATGSLGGTPFNATIVLTMNNNTTNVTSAFSVFTNTGTLMVSVPGFPTATFTDTIQAVSNQVAQDAGFGDSNHFGILFTVNASFSTYDLKTAFGPVLGPAAFNTGQSFPTTDGLFVLNSIPNAVTFTATTAAPEPGSLTMLGVALTGLGLLARRRKS